MKSRKKILGIVCIAFFFIACTALGSAVTDKEAADAFYAQAAKLFSIGSCENASEMANRALNLYTSESDGDGASKTRTLIGEISDCIKKNADAKYDQAYKSYIAKKWADTVSWAQRAKEEYLLVPGFEGENGVAKCENLISDAISNIGDQENAQAEDKYNRAYAFFEQEDFQNAKKLAAESLNLYNDTNNEKGVKLCNAFLLLIDKKVDELRSIADDNLAIAEGLYRKEIDEKNFGDYLEATKKAQEAEAIYSQIGYVQGFKDAHELIATAARDIDEMEGSAKQKALKSYNEGRDDLVMAKVEPYADQKKTYLDQAEKSFNDSRLLYQMLYERAKNIGDSNKTDDYEKLRNECDQKIAEVQTERKNMAGAEDADGQFTDALSLYGKGECDKALSFANQAKDLFTAANERTGTFKCDTLIYQINECIKKINKARVYVANADRFYRAADYVNATLELRKAEEVYEDVKNQQGIDYCSSLRLNVMNSIKKKAEADGLMTMAYDDYQEKNAYEEAGRMAQDAENIYSSIGYREGVAKAKDLINKSNERITTAAEPKQQETAVTIAAFFGAVALVTLLWTARNMGRQKAEKLKADVDKQKIEEETSRGREEHIKEERPGKRRSNQRGHA